MLSQNDRETLQRQLLLNDLLAFNSNIDAIEARLKQFSWDSAALVTLTASHIHRVLQLFLSGHTTNHAIERWANIIEGRDDIAYAPETEAWIRDTIHILANPLLTESLTQTLARQLLYQK